VLLAQGNLYTQVTSASDDEVKWLRSKESGLVYGNKKGFFVTGQIEQVRFFDLETSRFPAGFTPQVVAAAKAAGFTVQQVQATKATPPDQDAVLRLTGKHSDAWLRDYQRDAVTAALAHRRGILQVATGGGKTEIAIGLILAVPCRWLALVHRKTLMDQFADRYELRTQDKSGRIGEGKFEVGERLTVSTFQTLASLLKRDPKGAAKFLAQFDGLIADEAHVVAAESFNRVTMALPNAAWRIGISATPLDREDQRSVYAVSCLGPVIYELRGAALIERGLLAAPEIRMVQVRQVLQEVDAAGFTTRWPWKKVYEEGVVRSKERNRALLAATQQAEKPCLVFVKEVAHGRAFNKALALRGLKSEFVWGTASLQQRKDAVRRLERGDLDVVVCSVIFQEGVDIPDLRSVVIASGGKSIIASLQRLGRGMRVAAGKTTFQCWDCWDVGNLWLERHAKARRRSFAREGYAVSVVQLAPSYPPGQQPKGDEPKQKPLLVEDEEA
jgi:superfamily II DNA or RNA helicase